ncbi:histidine triad nucleotide-binding protein [Solemya pervernicosa gill symbiont]|uniref:Histidine triad nucleotide-binding protein n=2 Tax=Gammaproteobacteria incertae sedis TaxID=118884 RepID=A0A1T2L541_9GAMM|nr:histidine triad nucleotide-binding protein [Candidatus Reidiella endopervernicosa]OOZ40203.1 histidine triad nucleotide-binding protein [Solemya pervernicosa gill symbiont]QKQ27146.1 histidine triad nucleotide-binding protein [Candidatus Reidiella endopervernicosa]
MEECLFCKMVAGEIEPQCVYEDEQVLAFRDINPQAPTHVLIIPKQHLSTINDLDHEHEQLVGRLYIAAQKIAATEGLADSGYRTVMNCNADAGQTVFHIHLHLLGGRRLGWPPG